MGNHGKGFVHHRPILEFKMNLTNTNDLLHSIAILNLIGLLVHHMRLEQTNEIKNPAKSNPLDSGSVTLFIESSSVMFTVSSGLPHMHSHQEIPITS